MYYQANFITINAAIPGPANPIVDPFEEAFYNTLIKYRFQT